jgi:hypothetical protein
MFSRVCSLISPIQIAQTWSPETQAASTPSYSNIGPAMNLLLRCRSSEKCHRVMAVLTLNVYPEPFTPGGGESKGRQVKRGALRSWARALLGARRSPMWSMFGRAGHGGTTECCGNGTPSLHCGRSGPGKLGTMGCRPGVDAMGLAVVWGRRSCPRHDWLFSVARLDSNERSESKLNAFPGCSCRICPFLRTPDSNLLADSPPI